MARRLLTQNDTLKNRVAEIFDSIGMTQQVRAQQLRNIATGRHRQVTVTTISGTDSHGKTIELTRKTVKTPSAQSVTRAIEVAYKADGTYQQQAAAAAAVSKELSAIFKQQRKQLQQQRSK